MLGDHSSLVVDSPRSVQKLSDLDLGFGVGSPRGSRRDVDEEASEPDGVVVEDGGGIAEGDLGFQVEWAWDFSPSLVGIAGLDGESAIERWEEGLQEPIGLLEVVDVGAGQFGAEAVLEGPEESFDSSFGLGGKGKNRLNGKGFESHPDLSGKLFALQLFFQSPVVIVTLQGSVPVLVNGKRDPILANDLVKQS